MLVYKKNRMDLLLIFTLAAALIFSISNDVFAAKTTTNVDIAIKAGFDDVARVGYTVPFRISLANKGSEISGEAQVVIAVNPEQKVAYAMPFNLPENSAKEIVMNIPVNTANKNVEVRLVKGTKILRTAKYTFKKLIAPETPVIGILTDDPAAFKALKGIKVAIAADPAMQNEMQMKMAAAGMVSAVQAQPVESGVQVNEIPAEIIMLDAASLPDNIKTWNGFDIFAISNFDTSELSVKQLSALEEWVKSGKMLFIGTGSGWKKVYDGLKNELKPFSVEKTVTIPFPKTIGDFTGKEIPAGSMEVAAGNIGGGKALISENGLPLAVSYKLSEGVLIELAFDPSMSPTSDWSEVQTLWKNLITAANKVNSPDHSLSQTSYQGYVQPYMDYQYLASNVPETQSPPFILLLVLVGVYILLAGPVLYIFLKWKDKRDLSWILIPAAALLFMGIIYVAGYKTRYTTAVINNISVVKFDTEKQKAEIKTWIGAFNNGRGNMKIEYDSKLGLEVNSNFYYDRYSMAYNQQNNQNTRVSSKYNLIDPPSIELYDVRLWEARYLLANKTINSKGFAMDQVSIDKGEFAAIIKNNSEYNMEEAFVIVGSNFIDIGKIAAGTSKKVNARLDDPAVKKRFDDFLDARYGQPYYNNPVQKLPAGWREMTRKRNIIENVVRNMLNNNQGNTKMMFFALSYDDQNYNVIINGKEPKKFSTNVLYSLTSLNFEKGRHVEIPEGIYKPVLEDTKIAYFDDPVLGGLRLNADGDIFFRFSLPDNIDFDKLSIDSSTFLPSYMKYQPKPAKGQPQPKIAKNTYKFFIFNNYTGKWEEVSRKFIIDSNINDYVNNKNDLRLKINATLGKEGSQEELLGMPGIRISGVVK